MPDNALVARTVHAPDARTRNLHLDLLCCRDPRPKYVIAALSGMPGNTFGGVITGRVIPTESAKARIAAVLECSVEDAFPSLAAVDEESTDLPASNAMGAHDV